MISPTLPGLAKSYSPGIRAILFDFKLNNYKKHYTKEAHFENSKSSMISWQTGSNHWVSIASAVNKKLSIQSYDKDSSMLSLLDQLVMTFQGKWCAKSGSVVYCATRDDWVVVLVCCATCDDWVVVLVCCATQDDWVVVLVCCATQDDWVVVLVHHATHDEWVVVLDYRATQNDWVTKSIHDHEVFHATLSKRGSHSHNIVSIFKIQ